jgi:hypothetical protein
VASLNGIVGAIQRTERPVAGDAALEFLRYFLEGGLLQRISAASEEKSEKESDG